MKKISFVSLSAFICAIAVSVFTAQPVTAKETDPTFHWFLDGTNQYVGQLTLAQIEQECPGIGKPCARGYNNIDAQGNPVGDPAETAQKQ